MVALDGKLSNINFSLKNSRKCHFPLQITPPPPIKYEISISMIYLIQTKKSLLILSNLSPINRIGSF